MGDISDEHDEEVIEFEKIDENTYIIDGSVLIDEVNEKFHLKLEPENYDTLSGFLIEQLGYIPSESEHLTISDKGVSFQILETKEKRIRKVRLNLISEAFRNSIDSCTCHKNMMETMDLPSKTSAKSDFKK